MPRRTALPRLDVVNVFIFVSLSNLGPPHVNRGGVFIHIATLSTGLP
jgi:hypothetical protein